MSAHPLSRSFRFALTAFLVGAAAACSSSEPAEDGASTGDAAAPADSAPVAVVETVTLTATSFTEYIDLTGVTEPIRAAAISAEVGGRIIEYNLVAGKQVKKGDTLLRVDASQAGAQASQLQAQLDQLDADLARTERLVERGLSSQQQLDQLRSQREATYQSMRSVRIGVGNARIRAPFDATVLDETSELGEFASPGNPVARIGDLSTVKVMVGLPEREIAFVQEGARARVEIPALGRVFVGTVARVGLETDRRNRSFPIEVHVDNEEGLIRSGMRAQVMVRKAEVENAIAVPRDVLRQGLNTFEAVLVRDGRVVVRDVSVGPAASRYVVVREGLAVGDELVIRGQRDLVSGERVSASSQGACCDEQIRAATALPGAHQQEPTAQ